MDIEQRIHGAILGVAVADSIGALFEGNTQSEIHRRFEFDERMFDYAADAPRHYTDDTEMTLALAEYLAKADTIEPLELMGEFVKRYSAWRGYGRGTRVLVDAFRFDADYEYMTQHLFPGGSYGNGAAMRAAPVGLRFSNEDEIWQQAKESAWPTHRHELGIEGAQLIALATRFAATVDEISSETIADHLLKFANTLVFKKQLKLLRDLKTKDQLEPFGNGIEAHESVVTAIACFSLYPKNFKQAVSAAIWLGGDTDTIAAMTGALVGAAIGPESILPYAELLEPDDGEFCECVSRLAKKLANAAR